MFKQAELPVQDAVRFGEIKLSLEQTFASANVAGYLRRLRSAKLRARDFEKVLARGLLGKDTAERYQQLPESDRGQVREFYLSLVERVPPGAAGKVSTRFTPTTEEFAADGADLGFAARLGCGRRYRARRSCGRALG